VRFLIRLTAGRFAHQNKRGATISRRENRINREIRTREVRLVDETGKQLGIYPTREALRVAEERDLDLVEVAPNASPPVCRIMDYGKFLYDRQRREREARRTQKQTEVKEIRLRPKIADHDVMVKSKQARGFLSEGNKVRVRVRFRGREITHREIAIELLNRFAGDLSDVSTIEQRPAMEGYTMLMILAPSEKQ
jgi:translation initiation factor IF-3